MTKKGKRTALLQRTEEIAELRKENEQLRARLAALEQTDEKLRQSEERYRLLADNASDVIWVADMDLNLTYVSPSAARILGCSKDELTAPLVRDLLLPDTVRSRIESLREQSTAATRRPSGLPLELTLETRLRLRDGSAIWVEDKINFIRDAANCLTGIMGITREITDRREAEEELRASEQRSRLMLENANEGIAVVQNGVLKFANPKLAAQSGYSREELISKPFSQLIHPDDLPLVMDYYARRLKGDRLSEVYTVRFVDKAGATRWGEVNAVLIDWDGEPAVLAMINDITERKRGEEAQRESEERFRAIVSNAPNVAIEIFDRDGRVVYWNPAAESLYGFAAVEAVGKTLDQLILDSQSAAEFLRTLREIGLSRTPVGPSDWECTVRDGRRVAVTSTIFPLPTRTGTDQFVCMDVDITERKRAEDTLRKSEERFKSMVEDAFEGIAILSKEGVTLYQTPRVKQTAGLDAEEVIGTNFLDRVHPDDVDRAVQNVTRLVSKPGTTVSATYRIRFPDGSYRFIESTGVNLIDNPSVGGLVVNFRDITERKLAEEALRESEDRFRLLFERSAEAQLLLDHEGKVVDCNDAMLRLFALSDKKEVVGHDPEEFAPEFQPDGTPSSNMGTTILATVLEKGSAQLEWAHLKHDPQRTTIMNELICTLIPIQGRPFLHVAIRDITERKLAEEELQKLASVVRFSSELVNLATLDGKMVFLNAAGAKMLGIEPDTVGDHSVLEVIPEPWLAEVRQNLLPALLVGGTWEGELQYRNIRTGRLTDVHAMTFTVKDAATGAPLYLANVSRDITERRLAEEALQRQERYFRAITENSSDVVLVLDKTATIRYVSPNIENLLGIAREKMMRDAFGASVHPDDMQQVASYWAYFEDHPEGIRHGEIRVRHGDGSWRDIEATGRSLLSDPAVEGVVINMRDITERKRAEEALRESEERYRQIANCVPDLVWIVDLSGRFTYANSAVERTHGFTVEEYKKRTIEDVVTPRQAAIDRAMMEEGLTKAASPQYDRNTIRTWESEELRKDGSTFSAEVSAAFLWSEDGKPVGIIGVGRDITERKRAEEEVRMLSSVVEQSTEGMAIARLDGILAFVNEAWCRMHDYKNPKELLGKNLAIFHNEEQMENDVKPFHEEVMELGACSAEVGHVTRDGRPFPTLMTTTLLKDKQGKPYALAGIAKDITESKQMEDELRRAHDELEVRVEQRTAELQEANALLLEEVRQRQQAQDERQETESNYRDLVENANSIILELDTMGKISFLNRFAQDFFGFTEEQIVGRHVVGTIAPPTDSEGNDLKVKIKDLTKHPEDHYASESEGIRQDGKRVWISWTNKGLYDKKGRLRRILCIGMDRTEQRQVAAMLAEQEKEKGAAAERQRLARDLHDAVTQTLFSASLIAEVLPQLWEKDHAEGERCIEELRRLTRGALAEMRILLLELRPAALGEVGLTDLLRQLGEATTGRTTLPVALSIRGKCTAPLDVQVALYRVAQEALNNVVKHSGATKANVRLYCRENSADLTISDNGAGFDLQTVSPKSLGLRIMRERAEAAGANLKIESQAGQGTKVGVLWSGATRKGGS